MKYIVRTTHDPSRVKYLTDLQEAMPELIVSVCEGNAMGNFYQSLRLAGDDAVLMLEDDAILCKNFLQKLHKVIEEVGDDKVIQLFSMRKDDLDIGTRWISGRKFMTALCYYTPKGMAKEVLAYRNVWKRHQEHPTGLDLLFADYLGDNKIKYYNVVPNLADHAICKSIINPRRSSKRQSKTFKG